MPSRLHWSPPLEVLPFVGGGGGGGASHAQRAARDTRAALGAVRAPFERAPLKLLCHLRVMWQSSFLGANWSSLEMVSLLICRAPFYKADINSPGAPGDTVKVWDKHN